MGLTLGTSMSPQGHLLGYWVWGMEKELWRGQAGKMADLRGAAGARHV